MVYRFSQGIAFPLSNPTRCFLTLCAGGKYTNKFRMLPRKRQRLNGEHPKPWRAVNGRLRKTAWWRTECSQAGLRTKGELLCQSVHFSRTNGAAPRRTDFDHA